MTTGIKERVGKKLDKKTSKPNKEKTGEKFGNRKPNGKNTESTRTAKKTNEKSGKILIFCLSCLSRFVFPSLPYPEDLIKDLKSLKKIQT